MADAHPYRDQAPPARTVFERAPPVTSRPLTSMCSSGGCTAKYAGDALTSLLASIPHGSRSDLLVGLEPPDDGVVLRISDSSALVLTVDFFPPIVDDPFDFGRISANNALNDVYAMGGTPAIALSIAVFPEEMPNEISSAILNGAATQCRAAGAVLAGGHTIRGLEPTFGLAVAGFVDPRRMWLKAGAQQGDILVLTKPLGTGLIVTGQRRGRASTDELEQAKRWMLESSADAADTLRDLRPHAVTDVTGFGLLGHAREMAAHSGVRVVMTASAFPLVKGAEHLAREGVRTSGDRRNRDLLGDEVSIAPEVDPALVAVGLDPQTAGGLLIALRPCDAAKAQRAFRSRRLFAQPVGFAAAGSGVEVRL
jgi:selenide,water dikinase